MIKFKDILEFKSNDYIFTSKKIMEKTPGIRYYDFGDETLLHLNVKDHTYNYYLKSKPYEDPKFNYIYEPISDLNIFDKEDIKYCLENNIFDIKKVNHFFGSNEDVHGASNKIESYLSKNSMQSLEYFISDFKLFIEEYDGFVYSFKDRDLIVVFKNKLLNNNKLLDGNLIRHPLKSTDFNIEIPEWVIDELQRYTKDPLKRINATVKQWLKENLKLPYSSITLYRGVGTDLNDWGDYTSVTIDSINKKLKSRFGLSLKTIEREGNIISKRGKESSWSTKSEIASRFVSGMAEKDINFIIHTTVDASMIVVDFNELPDKYKDEFAYINQHEVILDTGTITGKIKDTNFSDNMLKHLKFLGHL